MERKMTAIRAPSGNKAHELGAVDCRITDIERGVHRHRNASQATQVHAPEIQSTSDGHSPVDTSQPDVMQENRVGPMRSDEARNSTKKTIRKCRKNAMARLESSCERINGDVAGWRFKWRWHNCALFMKSIRATGTQRSVAWPLSLFHSPHDWIFWGEIRWQLCVSRRQIRSEVAVTIGECPSPSFPLPPSLWHNATGHGQSRIHSSRYLNGMNNRRSASASIRTTERHSVLGRNMQMQMFWRNTKKHLDFGAKALTIVRM